MNPEDDTERTSADAPANLEAIPPADWVEAHKAHVLAIFAHAASKTSPPSYLDPKYLRLDKKETVLFVNSIGGFGDTIPVLLAMKLYRKYRPQDTLVLYDSMFLNHYYDISDYADTVVQGSQLILSDYAPKFIASADKSLPLSEGRPLESLHPYNITRIASTHHAHNRILPTPLPTVKLDIVATIVDSALYGCLPFQLKPRAPHLENIDALMKRLRRGNRPLIGLQNRTRDPYNVHQISGAQYKAELEEIASGLVDKFNAVVVLCGDISLDSATHYDSGNWVDLNAIEPNVYLKMEALSRCDYLLGAVSGFSMLANLMRKPDQSPGVLLYGSRKLLEDRQMAEIYPSYFKDGGGTNFAKVVWNYQDPALIDFMFDMPHTPTKVLAFVERLIAADRHAQAEGMKVPSKWLVSASSELRH